ncbi:MAG: TonB-dependent receptor plug domain-containing protein [Pseudomonadota bacterium]
MDYTHRLSLSALTLSALLAATAQAQEAKEGEEEMTVLEEFIVTETDSALNDSLLPTEREISGLFGDTTNILQVPRAVTLLSPAIMDQFNIEDLTDLKKVAAGTQTYNFYGIAGTPVVRGAEGGTFLNGMLRAYQRNEMPLSFGSLEAIDIVKGPAPADFAPTQIGGFVNLIPKSPFYDEAGGSVTLDVDEWGMERVTADVGAPFLLPGETPAAFRLSLTSQDGETYWDDVDNDYTSVYAALKFQPADGVSVFVGGEYFDFQSNENAGWNRPTQELIDNDQYVIGEPAALISPQWRGTVDREGVEFPGTGTINPSLFSLGIPGDVARARISDADRANMLNLNLAEDRAILYAPGGFGGDPTDTLAATLAANQATPQDTFVYTQEYFDNGGVVLTDSIDGSTVLADTSDFADSEDLVLFGDVIFSGNPSRTYTLKFLYEDLETTKRSSYGYAVDTEQTVASGKFFVTDRITIPKTTSTVGANIRYTDGLILQDFFAEPFARRDILNPTISPNTVLLVGDDSPVGGLNLWSPTAVGGANVESELTQYAVFATFETQWTDRISTIAAVRYEYADFDIGLPGDAERAAQDPSNAEALEAQSGDTDYFNWSIGPNIRLFNEVYLYGSYQEGTSIDPTQGGAIFGEQNFAENEMWEVGFKGSFLDGKLYGAISFYEWEQSQFNVREGLSEALEAEGLEIEVTWQVSDNFTLISSWTDLEVRRQDPLGFRTIPLTEQDWALYAGELTSNFSTASFDGRLRDFEVPTNNQDLVYPGQPQKTFKLFGLYKFAGGFSANLSMEWQEEFFLDFDNTKELPEATIFNTSLRYTAERWEVAVGVDNLTDEEYFLGADPIFGANTLVTKAPERTLVGSFKVMF